MSSRGNDYGHLALYDPETILQADPHVGAQRTGIGQREASLSSDIVDGYFCRLRRRRCADAGYRNQLATGGELEDNTSRRGRADFRSQQSITNLDCVSTFKLRAKNAVRFEFIPDFRSLKAIKIQR